MIDTKFLSWFAATVTTIFAGVLWAIYIAQLQTDSWVMENDKYLTPIVCACLTGLAIYFTKEAKGE